MGEKTHTTVSRRKESACAGFQLLVSPRFACSELLTVQNLTLPLNNTAFQHSATDSSRKKASASQGPVFMQIESVTQTTCW